MARGWVVAKSNGIRWARHRERMDRNRHIKIIALAAVTIDELCNSITQSFAKNITRLFFHLRIECTITPMNGYRPISTCPQSAHFWFWSWPWPRLKQTYCQHNLHSYKSFVHSNASNTSRRAKPPLIEKQIIEISVAPANYTAIKQIWPILIMLLIGNLSNSMIRWFGAASANTDKNRI